nr:AAA-ATPase ASD, mitochondrial-like [Tanacetum cinerariifolium]
MDDYEEVLDEFKGIKIWWSSRKIVPEHTTLFLDPGENHDKWFYKLTCHKKHQDFIKKVYLNHVFEEGGAISQKKRQRKLYTNTHGDSSYDGREKMWSHILFEHPSTFETLAMDPKMKRDIINDLENFSKSKDYYNKIGKAWKRGYLLYGPPGTGKSSMIAAMANFLNYDIYDIELNSVKNNSKLRKLLIDTSSKAIIVIEDIDCSLDLAGKRKENKEKETDQENKDKISEKVNGTCGSEKIIVFTTNHIGKLDPALIRRGRMDVHTELSYCCFEAFKVLAKNYLDVESHELFATIGQLLKETNMTPADVAENLMPKSVEEKNNADTCLNNLIKCLEDAKEEARLKAMKEASIKSNENGEKVQDGKVTRKSSNKSEENDG